MMEETSKIKKRYIKTFTAGLFGKETITLGEILINHLYKDRNDRWHETHGINIYIQKQQKSMGTY